MALRGLVALEKVCNLKIKGENLRHDHVRLMVNIFSIERQ